MGDKPDRADQAGQDAHLPGFRGLIAAAALRRLRRAVVDIVFPRRCLACGTLVEAAGALCPDCWTGFTFLGPPVCACCGFPFAVAAREDALCAACAASPPDYTAARSALVYDDASRDLLLAFKHGDRTHYAPAFGLWLLRAAAAFLPRTDLVVPVPLHPWRLFRRRFNQAALLARVMARTADRPMTPDLLVRRRNTPSQGRLSRLARARNVRGAFTVRPSYGDSVAGKRVLLVDDVFTTGATIEACSRALRRAGAAEVYVVTLARVVRPQQADGSM